MRSAFAYTPRRRPLQTASPGAAVAYLGALVAVAFLFSAPLVLLAVALSAALAGLLAGAARAVRAAFWLGLAIALPLALVNALVVNRGETVLVRLGDWPLLGETIVTAEALADGLVFGLRALAAMIAFAVYSACVDPDRVLRALRPLARRSALTATLVSRLVPLAAADATRLREAARLRGPAAAPLGRAGLLRRLLTGSLDRSVDVAATLELRGYSLPQRAPGAARGGVLGRSARVARRSRYDRRFYLAGGGVLVAAVVAKVSGAGGFDAYPTVSVALDPVTIALCLVVLAAGLAPWRRHG